MITNMGMSMGMGMGTGMGITDPRLKPRLGCCR